MNNKHFYEGWTQKDYVDKINKAIVTHGIFQVLNDYSQYFPVYPEAVYRPTAPKTTAHSSEILSYAKRVEEYEVKKAAFDIYKEEFNTIKKAVEDVMIEEMKIHTGFYHVVPEKSQSKVWAKAWDEGHSSGYYSVYQALESLVDLFE